MIEASRAPVGRVTIVGGGPAGLYCAVLLKKARPDRDVTLVERNPAGATYGWGVVFSDRTLAAFREADEPTYTAITEQFVLWDAIDVYSHGRRSRCGGHVFAGIARTRLLAILQERCAALGVHLRFEREVSDLADLGPCDLLVGADGLNSVVRAAHARHFTPSLVLGRSRYIWLGTTRVLGAFTFMFVENEHGVFQAHAYPFDGRTSTFIVECDEVSWRRAGLDTASEEEGVAYCERLFAEHLHGQPLMSNASRWINFPTVKNARWRHGNVVLLGDAAHTAHFSIGSGTKLAMEDAIALASALERHGDLGRALDDYEAERRPAVEAFQQAAAESRAYFERIGRYLHLPPAQFTFHLLTRSGRISYDDLRLRDPHFVDEVDRALAGANAATVAPPPIFTPLRVREMTLPNRIACRPPAAAAGVDGVPREAYAAALTNAAPGVGLVLTSAVAVSPEGRITPDDPGMYTTEHMTVWTGIVRAVHRRGGRVGAVLNHAGPRGACRPRWEGLDRPLPAGGWPLVSASPLPYTPRSRVPREADEADMEEIRDDFVRAAGMAQEAEFDLLQLHCGHGYLLGGFISPLTNKRGDRYGGGLEARLRFPLSVVDAVRAVWPQSKPLAAIITVDDGARRGLSREQALAAAGALAEHGCDLLEVVIGQTTAEGRPAYGRGYLAAYSDVVRNEVRVPTMMAGYLRTTGEMNTSVAAGRADLCIIAGEGATGGAAAAPVAGGSG